MSEGQQGPVSQDVPECVSDDGHAWVSGRAELNDEEMVEIVSRQCRICGYEQELDDCDTTQEDSS